MATQPAEILLAGIRIVDPVLVPHDFRFLCRSGGRGSGGDFVWGEYVRDNRRLELHFRTSLGMVAYHLGRLVVAHEPYLRALGVPVGRNQYPGFSDDPLDGFRHLAHDLSHFCADFHSGDGSVLREAARAEMAREAALHAQSNAGGAGDLRARQEARACFRERDYERVVVLLDALCYPELLSDAERRMLDIARRRAGGPTSASS